MPSSEVKLQETIKNSIKTLQEARKSIQNSRMCGKEHALHYVNTTLTDVIRDVETRYHRIARLHNGIPDSDCAILCDSLARPVQRVQEIQDALRAAHQAFHKNRHPVSEGRYTWCVLTNTGTSGDGSTPEDSALIIARGIASEASGLSGTNLYLTPDDRLFIESRWTPTDGSEYRTSSYMEIPVDREWANHTLEFLRRNDWYTAEKQEAAKNLITRANPEVKKVIERTGPLAPGAGNRMLTALKRGYKDAQELMDPETVELFADHLSEFDGLDWTLTSFDNITEKVEAAIQRSEPDEALCDDLLWELARSVTDVSLAKRELISRAGESVLISPDM